MFLKLFGIPKPIENGIRNFLNPEILWCSSGLKMLSYWHPKRGNEYIRVMSVAERTKLQFVPNKGIRTHDPKGPSEDLRSTLAAIERWDDLEFILAKDEQQENSHSNVPLSMAFQAHVCPVSGDDFGIYKFKEEKLN